MSLISRICVAFLGWLAIGFIAYAIVVTWWAIKVALADPENFKANWQFVIEKGSGGLISRGDSNEDAKGKVEELTGRPFFVEAFVDYITWPSGVANVQQGMSAAYKEWQDECYRE